MVNVLKNNLSPLPAGIDGKSTRCPTWRRHQANQTQTALEAEEVRALGALQSLRSKETLAVGKRPQMYFLSNEEMEKQIEDYVERETTVERKRVQDAVTPIK